MLSSLLTTLVLVRSAFAQLSCLDGWYFFPDDNSCIKGFNTPKTFLDARQACQDGRGDLVQLDSPRKSHFVSVVHSDWYWMGVWDVNHDRHFAYVDGSPLSNYQPWRLGEPNNAGNREHCVLVVGKDSSDTGQWNDGYCNDKLTFVCQRPAQDPSQAPVVLNPAKYRIRRCPSTWSFYARGNTCIKGYGDKKSFSDAREYCQSRHGDLVQVDDNTKAAFVTGLHADWYWMGVWDRWNQRRFSFVSGMPVGYFQPWRSGEPNNAGGKESCVVVVGKDDPSTGQWNDGDCNTKLSYVCEIPAKGCPFGYSHHEGDNSCLKAFKFRKSWVDANSVCAGEGGFLTQVKNPGKKAFISSLLSQPYWLGLRDDGHDGQWTYLDGTPLGGFHPWNRGEPNNWGNNEFCAMALGTRDRYVEGKWNDLRCEFPLPFVCEV